MEIIKKGSRFTVGSGEQIRINKDNVSLTHPPRPVFSTCPEEELHLSDFISTNGGYRYWDTTTISEKIRAEDHAIIQNIYLSQQATQDGLVWHYNKSGDYSVRSGYWLTMNDPSFVTNRPPLPHGSTCLKTKIWQLSILPKLKHFLWRFVTRSLATITRLNSRGMNIDPVCPRCFRADETINHIFFHLPLC